MKIKTITFVIDGRPETFNINDNIPEIKTGLMHITLENGEHITW